MQKKTNRIKEWRTLRGLSQTGLGKKMGCEKAKISKLERGILQLKQSDLEKMAKILECEVWELLDNNISITIRSYSLRETVAEQLQDLLEHYNKSLPETRRKFDLFIKDEPDGNVPAFEKKSGT